MSILSRFTIRAKLLAASVLAGSALLGVGAVSLQALHRLQSEFQGFSEVEYRHQAHLAEVQLQMGLVKNHEKDALLNFDDAEAGKRFKSQWKSALTSLRDELASLESSLNPQDQALMAAALADYERLAGDVIQRGINGQIVTATEANQALGPARLRLQAAGPVLEGLSHRVNEAARARSARVASTVQWEFDAILLAVIGTLALFAPSMWWICISITRRLTRAIGVADRIAGGDLASPITARGTDEVARLLGALGTMQSSLSDIVAQVRQTSDAIASASAQIASGSVDLSSRTDAAAADLRRTASNMQDLTALVSQAERTARLATEMSDEAVASAREGGEVVIDVAGRMSEISGTAHRIADITGLIDGIAFQTNLLALNAAVEAARAGEQGRGFGVVAAEVRSLAQRTAQAASEIKHLVAGSVERIDAGASRAQVAGRRVSDIIGAIERVSGSMQELSGAASEQSRDIQQVGDAVHHLETMTQLNASLVEQSTTAAESLRSQAGRLQQLVQRFQVARAG